MLESGGGGRGKGNVRALVEGERRVKLEAVGRG